MNIKFQALAQHLRQQIQYIYILTGLDHYLLNEAAGDIKKAWRMNHECDETKIQIDSPADWSLLQDEANSYSLFSDSVILDTSFDKKTIDPPGKKILQHYQNHINTRCLIIIRAPNVPAKQLASLANHPQTVLIPIYSLSTTEMRQWILTKLKIQSIQYQPSVPDLINQHTQGNMLACAQVIDKLGLIYNAGEVLTQDQVLEQLSDQCDYQLYELSQACLAGQAEKAIHILRFAYQNKTEPTLILWLLSQEIRLLIQLDLLIKQSVSISAAMSQLNIWPQRAGLYQTTLRRISCNGLHSLLSVCQQLDEKIKSNQSVTIWHDFERLALALC